MAESTREAALQALVAALAPLDVAVLRGDGEPSDISDFRNGGLILIGDGEVEVLEEMISPHLYEVQRRAELQIMVLSENIDAEERADTTPRTTAALDALLQQLPDLLAADAGLAAAVDDAEIREITLGVAPYELGVPGYAALVPILLSYTTSSLAAA